MIRLTLVAVVATAALVPAAAEAQRTPRRQAPIEIIGQVPTPQVVTVRPREVPAYDRRVLVPRFYDHDFWQSILPGYLVVRQRMVTGVVPGDSLALRRDTTGAAAPVTTPPPAAAPGSTPPPLPTTPPPAPAPVEPAAPPTSSAMAEGRTRPDGTRPAISPAGARPTP